MISEHTVAIIQARMGSTRLPGKVLRTIAGQPMIYHVVNRARRIPGVDQVVVATSERSVERPLVEYLDKQDIPYVRGSEEDVLQRYVKAVTTTEADVVVRITSDCPLLMPEVAGEVVAAFKDKSCDYASNILQRTYPRGLDIEVVSYGALIRAHEEAEDNVDREHVTRYIWRHPNRFRLLSVTDDKDRSDMRWTVDEIDDLRLVRKIYESLYCINPEFSYQDVLDLLSEQPEWVMLNRHVKQNTY